MPVKTHIPGTSVSIGYESETADRAVIRCLVTQSTSHTDAISQAVASVGSTLYSGTYNIPLVSSDATRFGVQKWIVTLQYGRSGKARRRNQAQRRIRIQSTLEYVDAYLINSATWVHGYKDSSDPSSSDWYALPLRGGNLQSPEISPKPYKVQRPMMKIQLDYTTANLGINDAELSKTGKLNSNPFAIGEIGGVFSANTLKYEGFESSKQDIGLYPWYTAVNLLYDPSGHYRQQAVWDQTLNSGRGKWKTSSNFLVADSTTF